MRFFLLTLTLFFSNFSHGINQCGPHFDQTSTLPKTVIEKFPELARTQPKIIKILGYQIMLHNFELGPLLQNLGTQQNRKALIPIVSLLHKKGTFEFPLLPKSGLLPAANNHGHEGGYSSFVWYRDLARAFMGISALKKLLPLSGISDATAALAPQKLGKAMLKLFTEKEQLIRTIKNIIDPRFLLDPEKGFKNVPLIRLATEPREQGRPLTPEDIKKEEAWGHKQNDALALYGHTILDAAKGDLSPSQIPADTYAQMVYMTAYFHRIKYFSMEDVGAWEEGMGIRTSSIGLVTSFLERFYDGFTNAKDSRDSAYFSQMDKNFQNHEIQKNLKDILKDIPEADYLSTYLTITQSIHDIPQSLQQAYKILFDRLGIHIDQHGTRTYSDIRELEQGRGADAAILHMLLYPPKGLTVRDRLHIISQIKKHLMGDSGFRRYAEDWFMLGNPYSIAFANKLPFSPDMFAVPSEGGHRPSTRQDRDQIYAEHQAQTYTKNMSELIAKAGSNQEAQWTFQDAMLVQIYVQLYKETGDRIYLNAAGFHLSRSLGMITGKDQISMEGKPMEAFKNPEAWGVLQLIFEGTPFVAYLASPNSPLNWATAEQIKGLYDYMSVLK